MTADYIFLKGKAMWFKHTAPNKFGAWSHELYPDEESVNKLKELKKGTDKVEGIKNDLKFDEDGYHIAISRKTSKTIRGKVVGFAPPIVITSDDKPLVDQYVGNGSDVTTKIEYYTYSKPGAQPGDKKGAAIRWFSTRIDNLVPFVINRDFDDGQEKQIRGLSEEAPQPLF